MKHVCKCVSHPIQACPLHSPKMHQSVHPQRPELSTHSPNKLVATENLAPRGVAVKIGRIIQLSVSLQCSSLSCDVLHRTEVHCSADDAI